MDTISNIWDKGYKQIFGVSENYYDDNSNDILNMPVVMLNNITTSVSDAFSSLSLMTFGGEPAKKSGKMMALASTGAKDKDGKVIVIPKFLSSDDNGNLSLFDLDAHTTKNDFSAKSLSSLEGNIKVATGGQLCIGSTCIDENQLKQLIRPDQQNELKPSDYYAMSGTTLIFEHYQSTAPLGWSLVKTIVPANKDAVRIVQQAYKISWTGNSTLDSDVSKLYTRYSLGSKSEIEKVSTKNGWTAWKSDVYTSNLNLNNWKLVDNNGLRFHYHADPSIVSSKTGHDAVTQQFMMQTDGYAWDRINGYYNEKFATKAEAIKHNDPVDLHAGNYVLASQKGNFDPDSYATYRGQGASDAFIIKRKNTSGRSRYDA